MTVLFNPIANSFSGASVAGSGVVIRWTYTVPAGKRSVFTASHLQISASAAAVNTGLAVIDAFIGGVLVQVVRVIWNAGAVHLVQYGIHDLNLNAADFVRGYTQNIAAVNITMIVDGTVREYL